MADEFDHGSLIPVFLEEAREELRQLRTALASEEGAIPRQLDVRPLYLVAHTLRGSASMYGFRDVAELAGLLESRLEDSRELTDQEWHDQVFVLRELIDALEVQLQAIDRSGAEIAGMVDEWQARLGTPPPDPLQPEATPAQPESPAPDLPDDYLLPDVEPELLSCFAPEAQEYLQAMEQGLLRLEQNASDPETIQQLFRSAHTLKGSAYTVGFQSVGDVTHHLEDVMGAIREGRKSVTPELTDLLFKAVDLVRLLMRRDPASLALVRGEFTGVTCRLEQECREEGPVADAEQVQVTASPGEPEPVEPVALPGQPAEDPVVKPEAGSPPASESAVIRVSRDRLERLLNLVGELVISRGRLEQRLLGLERLSAQVQACKARMIDTVRTFEEKHAFTLPTVPPGAASGGASSAEAFMDFGALEFDKYDDFNILARRISEVSADVGESMAQLSGSIRKAREDMSQLQRLSVSMRDEIARSRMVPIGTPFTRFRRAAREMARATGKEVTVSMSGEQTEVDTGVVDRLVDPLVHLVRNAIFHGIEAPGIRVTRGKPANGTIALRAFHRGNSVTIEVEDDGAGIDVERVKAKAVSQGLLHPDLAAVLPDAEALKVIFAPGFSTVDDVGTQAGRGVGLDVVRRTIENLQGRLDVRTETGKGTTFSLTLPLTVLISMALLVRAGVDRYAIPLHGIREVMMPAPNTIKDFGGRRMLQLEEESVEVRPLAELLGDVHAAPEGPRPVVIVKTTTGPLGVLVDELLGRQEIVVKTLGNLTLFQASCFGGASIDPDGRVILVLEVGRLGSGADKQPALSGEALQDRALLSEPELPEGEAFPGEEKGTSRILLIDDSLSVRKFVGRMLEGAGYEVETAVDGEEGLRRAFHEPFGLIITDLEMPKLNGFEVIQALRQRPATKALPILVMTTRAGDKHRHIALNAGANAYIPKPVDERTLIQELERWLGQGLNAGS